MAFLRISISRLQREQESEEAMTLPSAGDKGIVSDRSSVQATPGIFPRNGTVGWLFSDPGFGFQAEILLTSLGLEFMDIATR